MNRVWTLIKKDLLHQSWDVVIVMAIILPLALALFVNLAFGNIFTDRARLGVYTADPSRVVQVLKDNDALFVRTYDSAPALRVAVARGSEDVGVALPAGFDAGLESGVVRLDAYVWGESLAKDRVLIPAALVDAVHQVAGSSPPVDIHTSALGAAPGLPWNDRLLPLVVLMAVFFGGMMLPASSLISEKQKRTLEALFVTPSTLGQVFLAKGAIGAALALAMGALTLAVSGYGSALLALLPALLPGAVMAAEIGLFAGAYIQDMNTLYAAWKFGGLLLFGPAVVFMFPSLPQWLGYLFPTYYVVKPVVDISVSSAGLGAEKVYLLVLAALLILGALAVSAAVRRLAAGALRLT